MAFSNSVVQVSESALDDAIVIKSQHHLRKTHSERSTKGSAFPNIRLGGVKMIAC